MARMERLRMDSLYAESTLSLRSGRFRRQNQTLSIKRSTAPSVDDDADDGGRTIERGQSRKRVTPRSDGAPHHMRAPINRKMGYY
jgi:hypothetical protein